MGIISDLCGDFIPGHDYCTMTHTEWHGLCGTAFSAFLGASTMCRSQSHHECNHQYACPKQRGGISKGSSGILSAYSGPKQSVEVSAVPVSAIRTKG